MENSAGTPPTVAGWYDDPDDANFTRYFNGRNWSGEKVPKERNLTFNSDKVYRPGGVTKREEPAPVEPEVKDNYQPLTRRERREREQAEQLKRGIPVAVDNDMEFEFQTAQPTQKSYVRSEEPSGAEPEELIETPLPLPALEEAETSTDLQPLAEDSEFSFGDFPPLDSADEESEETETPALPELDFSGIGTPVAADEQDDADDLPESRDEEDATPALPTLDFDSEEETPAADAEDDFEWSVPAAKEVRYVPAPEDGIDFFSEDDFVAAPDKDREDLLDDGEVEIVIPPVAAAEPVRRSYERPAPVEAAAPVSKKEEPAKKPDTAVVEEADDDEPVGGFGFASKLSKWQSEAPEEEAVTESPAPKDEPKETTALPAVASKDEEDSSEESDSEEDEDDDEDEIDEEPRGIRGRFKSFFSRNKNDDDVLEDEEGEDDEDSEDDADEELVEEAPESENVAPSSKHAPVEADADEEDADDSDDEIPMEEPQLKAGLFSSRQEKEDAATELELLSRLQELANRVAALKKEETGLTERIERAKKEEKEINDRIVHAHEEHEVLDNLAKARRAEQQKETSREEDADLLHMIDSHTRPEDIPMDDLIEFEDEEPENKPKAEYEPGEDDSPKSTLPQLRF